MLAHMHNSRYVIVRITMEHSLNPFKKCHSGQGSPVTILSRAHFFLIRVYERQPELFMLANLPSLPFRCAEIQVLSENK